MKIAQEKKKKKELLILVIFLKRCNHRIHTNIKRAMRRCYDNKFDNLDEIDKSFYLKKNTIWKYWHKKN